MGKSIGIDLGTTNSVMCLMTTEPEILRNRENDNLTPSVVALRRSKKTGDSIIVGKNAYRAATASGKNFLYSVKRLMGRGYDDPEVQRVARSVGYEIVPAPEGKEGFVHIRLGDQLYTPTDISAMILRKLKEDAEFLLKEPVDSAVITVPAYFSERQKYATREAGLKAGLKVKKVIDEPSAAAIAYGIAQKDDQDRMVLVFDLGGGTFDVSILLMIGGLFQQMDNEGDMWLGGDDFDQLILNQVIHQVEDENGISEISSNPGFLSEIKVPAREAKEVLSSQQSTDITMTLTSVKDEDGMPINIEYEITRSEFDRMLSPFVEKAMGFVKKALDEAGLTKEEIDVVLLVGGSSSIPKFQEAVEGFFGSEKVLKTIDPMTCVAMGAAVLAKSLSYVWCPDCQHENPMENDQCEKCGADLAFRRDEPREVESTARTPKPYGIELEGGVYEEIIPKNEIYPLSEPYRKEFKTTMPDQRLIKIPVYEGSSDTASENEWMGNIWFNDLPPGLPMGTPIEVSMHLDQDMVFTIGLHIPGMEWNKEVLLEHGDRWQNSLQNSAMESYVQIKKEGHPDQKQQGDAIVQDIVRSIEAGDQAAAEQSLNQLQQLANGKEGNEEKPGSVSWRVPLENVMEWGQSTLDQVRPILPSDDERILAFEAWVEEAHATLEADDAVKGEQLFEPGRDKLFEMPLVGELVFSVLISDSRLNPHLRTRLDQAREGVFSSIRRRSGSEIEAALEAFYHVMKEARKDLGKGEQPKMDIKLLLGKK